MIKIDRRWTYGLLALLTAAFVIAGCAVYSVPEPAKAPQPQGAGGEGSDGTLDEIITTGARVKRSESGANMGAPSSQDRKSVV